MLRPVNGLAAHPRACAALMAVGLAVLPGMSAGPALGAGDPASHAAQEPPPVVPDSAPVAPDPAPIAPDPAPAPPNAGSQPAPDPPAAAPPPQSVEAQPAPTPAPQTTAATGSGSVRNPRRTRVRESRIRDADRDRARSRDAKSVRERPPSSASVKAVAPPLSGIDSDRRSGELMAAGLALLAVVLLSSAFLGYVSPLVRERELQRR